MISKYPNAPVVPDYLKSIPPPSLPSFLKNIPPPSLPKTSMQISPHLTIPMSPHKTGFQGAQLTSNMLHNKSEMPPNSPSNTMPNFQHGIVSSQYKIAQPYHPNTATIQGVQLANENDMACVEVWSRDQEMMLGRVKQLARTFKIVALDTEFPGDPLGSNDNWRETSAEEANGYIKKNVDCSKMISLGWLIYLPTLPGCLI